MDLVTPPPLAGDEPVGHLLFLGEPGHLGASVGHLVAGVLQPGGGPGEVLVEPVPVRPAGGPQDRQRSEAAPAVGAALVVGDGTVMLLLGQTQPTHRGGQLGGAVGGPVVPHLEVLGDPGADGPVHRVGVGGGGHRPARLVLGLCRLGALHVAVRDNIDDDEIIVETAYQPDPALWEPDFKTRRTSR